VPFADTERSGEVYDGVTICDGRIVIGTVFPVPGGAHAELASGKDLGRFANVAAATSAILTARRRL
jgi:hypothetical protein